MVYRRADHAPIDRGAGAAARQAIRRSLLRFIRSSSSPMPVTVLAELEAAFAVPVIEAYGMTEAAHQMRRTNPLLRCVSPVSGAGGRS